MNVMNRFGNPDAKQLINGKRLSKLRVNLNVSTFNIQILFLHLRPATPSFICKHFIYQSNYISS